MTWKQYLARLAVAVTALGVVVFVAVRAANATQGGHTRNALTVAGTLTGVTGTPTLAFTLRKGTTTCPATARSVVLNGTTFSAEVPLDGCPAFFDGSDVTVDVSVNGTPVVSGSAVNPVPYARYADHYGTPDCPVGYERDTTATSYRICRRRWRPGAVDLVDEVVRVGHGPSAFWIDRYEASAVTLAGSHPAQANVGNGASDGLAAFIPRTGQWTATDNPPLLAVSVAGRPTVNITWFQASEICRASGKRLPTSDEWLSAARGTQDMSTNCNVNNTTARATNPGGACVSAWGAQDMIGNVAEWTAEWYAGPGDGSGVAREAWPPDYAMDSTSNITSGAFRTIASMDRVQGVPSAVTRGGEFDARDGAGVFRIDLSYGPSVWHPTIGFRCVIPR